MMPLGHHPQLLANNPLTIPARTDFNNAAVTPTSDYPAKWSCLDKSVEEVHKPVIPSTLASHIGTRTPWDKDSDMVLLGSPSLGSESYTIGTSRSGLLDDAGIEDTYFAKNSIRCANSPYECETSTKTLLAMNCWTSTSSWSSVHCSLLYTLPNQMHKLCSVFMALLILPTRAVRVEDNSLKASLPSGYLIQEPQCTSQGIEMIVLFLRQLLYPFWFILQTA